MNLKEYCDAIVNAPRNLIERRKALNKAWNKILKWEPKDSITEMYDFLLEHINKLMIKICGEYVADDIKGWLDCDGNDQGFRIMSDDEIVENIM